MQKMHTTYLYFFKSYNLYLNHFFVTYVYIKIIYQKSDNFLLFYSFYFENDLFGNFHYHIRNQHTKIQWYINR